MCHDIKINTQSKCKTKLQTPTESVPETESRLADCSASSVSWWSGLASSKWIVDVQVSASFIPITYSNFEI